jgi:Class II flagellar assembly regulator
MVMRIEWTPPLRPTTPRRDERGTNGGDRGFAQALGAEAPPAPATAAAAPNPVGGLFALQEMADALTGRRRAVARGQALLDYLDELRLALLSGILPRERLAALARLARDSVQQVDDPRLAAILAEIELRAAVELAKLGEVT